MSRRHSIGITGGASSIQGALGILLAAASLGWPADARPLDPEPLAPGAAAACTDEAYNLDDNKVPAGWSLTTTRAGTFDSGKLWGRPTDGGVELFKPIASGSTSLVFEWDGTLVRSYWGDYHLVRFWTSSTPEDRPWTIQARNDEVNFPGLLRASFGGPGLDDQTSDAPFEGGPFHFRAVFTSGQARLIWTRLSSGSTVLDVTKAMPGLDLSTATKVQFHVFATVGDPIWMDNIKLSRCGASDLTTGLMAHYPLDGNADDASGYGHHGTVIGATPTTDRFGRANSAYFFDGTSSVIEAARPFDADRQVTFAGWYNLAGIGDPAGAWVAFFMEQSYGNGFGFMYNTGKSQPTFFNGGEQNRKALDYALPRDRWFHFALTYDGAAVKVYLDGQKIWDFAYSEEISDTGSLVIGADGINSFGTRAYWWKGRIDEIRVYNRALSASDIEQLFGGTFALVVTKSGAGAGAVTSAPAGIDCGSTCSASFASGTSVTLRATAAQGSTFAGWSGEGCSGTETCTVTMTQARSVTATFSGCALACLAVAPPTSSQGTAVPFSAEAALSGCAETVGYAWDFGDGARSTEQNPSHSYAKTGMFTWTVTASAGAAVCKKSGTIQVTGSPGCTTGPAVPRFTSAPTGSFPAGNPFTLAWTPTVGLTDRLGFYRVEVSFQADCSSPDVGYVTTQASVTVPTQTGRRVSFCAVVRAVSGDLCASGASEQARFEAVVAPAAFVIVQPQSARDAFVDKVGGAVPAGSTVVLRNIGGQAAALRLGSGVMVRPEPASFASVEPGQDVTVKLVFDPLIALSPGLHADYIRGEWSDGGQTRTVSTAINLTVLSTPRQPGTTEGAKLLLASSNELHFSKKGGNPPFARADIVNSGTVPVRIAPSIGPGGAWLSISGDFSTPLGPGEVRAFVLAVDRSRRATADGDPPVSTNVTFGSVDGSANDAAILQVFDEEPDPATSGANRPPLGTGETSLIVGSAVNASGAGGTIYLSDGWIRNSGSEQASADLYYTPNGQDGLTSPNVKKASVALRPYGTYRLADFVRGLFDATGTSGQVEIRSQALAQLAVRATADSLTNKEGRLTRYGAEVPTIRSAEGAVASSGASLTIPGIRGGAGSRWRTNALLVETGGKAADVIVRLRTVDGDVLAEKPVKVSAYSKVQVNSDDAELFPGGRLYDGGSLEVQPVSGAGAVAAFATVLDNASQAYTTRLGRFTSAAQVSSRGVEPAAATELGRLVIPSAAHSAGKNDSFYTTTLAITNGTAQPAQLRLTYRPLSGAPIGPRSLTVGARMSQYLEDVVGTFFGRTDGSAGMIVIEGQGSDLMRIVATSETSTPIDPRDPGRGTSPSTLPAYAPTALEAVGTPDSGASSLVVSHPGLEETSRFRTNLILAELTGQPAVVRVRAVPKGSNGVPLGERTYALSGFERVQVDNFLRKLADTESADAQFLDVETVVEGVSGTGRVVAVATKIDNDPLSKRSDIYVLGPRGVQQGGIGIGR